MKKLAKKLKIFLVCLLFSGCSTISIPQIHANGNTCACVQSKAECVMEVNSRRILYAYSADTPLPMASTTKILTAITVLEECSNVDENIIIPPEATGIEGSSVYLKSGDSYTVKDLLYGLMLRSGNDCATALALRFGGSIDKFSAKMNETAQKAGAVKSNFKNPHGLPCENHYTTAKDLSYITCYAMQNDDFREIVSTKYYQPKNWKNKNKLLYNLKGAIGVKTGYTKEAGRCLVSAATRENTTLVCTVLNSPSMYERSTQLLEDAFKAYQYMPIVQDGQTFDLTVSGKSVSAYAKKGFSYPLMEEEKALLEIKTYAVQKPTFLLMKEKIIGIFEIYLSNQLLFSGNLYKL